MHLIEIPQKKQATDDFGNFKFKDCHVIIYLLLLFDYFYTIFAVFLLITFYNMVNCLAPKMYFQLEQRQKLGTDNTQPNPVLYI